MSSVTNALFGKADQFQAQGANINNQNFNPALGQSANQFNQTFSNQNDVAGMLRAQAMGVGPNPAQIMLNQATDNAIKQNAGMLASSKGVSPALAARLAAQNGASMTQQAAGQGALMQANQSMNATSALGGLYGQMGSQALGMNQNLQNANANQNQALTSMAENENSTNAGASAANAQEQGQVIGGLLQGGGGAAAAALAASRGAFVPGKAKVSGDSQKNDTVPAMLSPGEVVLPRSVVNAKDPGKAAKDFVEHIKKQKVGSKKKEEPSFGKVLEMHRKLGAELKKCMGGEV